MYERADFYSKTRIDMRAFNLFAMNYTYWTRWSPIVEYVYTRFDKNSIRLWVLVPKFVAIVGRFRKFIHTLSTFLLVILVSTKEMKKLIIYKSCISVRTLSRNGQKTKILIFPLHSVVTQTGCFQFWRRFNSHRREWTELPRWNNTRERIARTLPYRPLWLKVTSDAGGDE